MNDLVLMLADSDVVVFNLSNYSYKIVNQSLLPVALRCVNSGAFVSALLDWFKMRAIQVSRKNRDKILKCSGFSSDHDMITLLVRYRALSLQDNYWVRGVSELVRYSDVNLYQNSFSKGMFSVALFGVAGLTINGSTPEVNQRGCMAKAYKRTATGVYLYKTGSISKIKAELFASRVAEYCDMYSVRYKQVTTSNHVCVRCKLETSESLSWVHARDFQHGGISPVELALKLSPRRYHEMRVFDFIVGNIDRHNENWAFEVDNENRVLGLSKMYDFDNCFLADKDTVSHIDMQLLCTAAIASFKYLPRAYFTRVKGYLRSQTYSSNSKFARYTLDRISYLESYI